MTVPPDDPSQLSPRPHPLRPVELPWGLGWDDLRCCSPAAERPVAAFVGHQLRGLRAVGRTQALTLRWAAGQRGVRERAVFLKLTDPDRPEAAKYRWLTARGAPVASLLGTAATAWGEVLVLELLPTIGTTPDQADDLLGLVASLNSIEDAPAETFGPLPGRADFAALLEVTLLTLLDDPTLVAGWLDGYARASREVRAGPRALNHGELAPQQVGWTAPEGGTPRLVAVDLETMALLPRYTDVAGLLPVLAERTGRGEDELLGVYLAALDRRTGRPSDPGTARRAVRVARVVGDLESLPWLVGAAGTAGVEEPRRAVARIEVDLRVTGLG